MIRDSNIHFPLCAFILTMNSIIMLQNLIVFHFKHLYLIYQNNDSIIIILSVAPNPPLFKIPKLFSKYGRKRIATGVPLSYQQNLNCQPLFEKVYGQISQRRVRVLDFSRYLDTIAVKNLFNTFINEKGHIIHASQKILSARDVAPFCTVAAPALWRSRWADKLSPLYRVATE